MEKCPSSEANSHSASQEIPAFYGTPSHWSIFWARWSQCTPLHCVFQRSIL